MSKSWQAEKRDSQILQGLPVGGEVWKSSYLSSLFTVHADYRVVLVFS